MTLTSLAPTEAAVNGAGSDLANPAPLLDMDEWNDPRQWLERLAKDRSTDLKSEAVDEIRAAAEGAVDRFEKGDQLEFAREVKEILEGWGYDGVIYKNIFEARGSRQSRKSYVAVSPDQIKSIHDDGTSQGPDTRC